MDSRVERPARTAEPARQEARPQEPVGREESGQGSRPAETWSHPLARPAPPVEQKSPAQMREEENKFNGWQQQHQRGQPAPEPRREEPRREERKNQ